jgi:hypothetical protein
MAKTTNGKTLKELKVNDEFFIDGKAFYCKTNKPNTKGRYPSNCYEAGVFNPSSEYDISQFVKDAVYTDKEGNETQGEQVSIKNSKYPIPIFDMNNERYQDNISIPNGTDITMFCKVCYSEGFNTEYLVVRAIKINEELKEFNPFANR